jgi:hypothetical protein
MPEGPLAWSEHSVNINLKGIHSHFIYKNLDYFKREVMYNTVIEF